MKSQAQRLVAVAGCVVLVGAAVACTAQVEQKPPKEEVTKTELEGGRHWRGPVSRVIDATREHGNLSADQEQSLDAIARELDEDSESRHQLREKLRRSAVAVVRSGSANSEEFDQSVHEAVRAVEARVQKGTDALEEIHGILEPAQRSAVAAALRSQIAEKFGRRRDEKRREGGFKRFVSHLMLSQLQIEQLTLIKKELLGDKQQLRPSREELLTLVDTFEGDDFRTALNALRDKKSTILRARVADAGKRTDSVLAIFTKEQRELLADLILEGPSKVLLGDRHEQTPEP